MDTSIYRVLKNDQKKNQKKNQKIKRKNVLVVKKKKVIIKRGRSFRAASLRNTTVSPEVSGSFVSIAWCAHQCGARAI